MGNIESTLSQNYGVTSKSWENSKACSEFKCADGVSKDNSEPVTVYHHEKRSDALFNAIAKGVKVRTC
jgi:hypothetical protein